MRAATCLVLLTVLIGGPAAAGPWPREVKGVFLSLAAERDRDGNSYAGLYGEYGLTPRSTLGIEGGRSNAGETGALMWMQRALGRTDRPDRWTVSLGAGAITRNGTVAPVGLVAAAWGRGLDAVPVLRRIPGGGWLAVEARLKVTGALRDEAEVRALAAAGATGLAYLTAETEAKAALTLGWRATSAMMLVNQLRVEDRKDTGFASAFAISVVRDLAGPAKVEVGVIAPLSGPGETAVKLGTWLEF